MNIFFGTDGWRGLIDKEINHETVSVVAQAFSDYCNSNFSNPSVAVAFDGRKYSKEFADEFAQVLSGNSINVFLSDKIIPTPVLSFAVKKFNLSAGVMITASHNPPKYNGIKFKANYGGPFFTEQTLQVEKLLYKNSVKRNSDSIEIIDFLPVYIEHINNIINFDIIKNSGIKILIDSMGGAGNSILENIFSTHQIFARTIFSNPDINFYGRNAEPIANNLLPLSNEIQNSEYSIGLATDGDADRIGVVMNDGQFLSAQETILVITDYLVNKKNLSGDIVKTSSVTNKLLKFQSENRNIFDVQVGFKYICEKMIEDDILFGCEESGGFGYKNHIPERDGILSALVLSEILAESGYKKITELINNIRKKYGRIYYDRIDFTYDKDNRLLILPMIFNNSPNNIAGYEVKSIQEFYSSRGVINGIKLNLSDGSRWLLLRASETEPLIRIYAEGNNEDEVKSILSFGKKIILEN